MKIQVIDLGGEYQAVWRFRWYAPKMRYWLIKEWR
jgi:hypothetical protein